jgi:hypothetical protein
LVLIISFNPALCQRLAAEAFFKLVEVPDYEWYGGCFGTGSGMLMGYWDRHGLPDMYTGPTAGGVAPLDSRGTNYGIRSLGTSRAGMDGRPSDKPGHIDDYWSAYRSDETMMETYESTALDPFQVAGRPEHTPDCIGDFIGLSQRKWTNMNNECDGNIDSYSFVYWDTNGNRRINFIPSAAAGAPARDIPSGLRAWTQWCGYDADVFSQLTDFNTAVPRGHGFTFNDMKAEIDAGFPVLLYMQEFNEISRVLPNMPRGNPTIHGMMAYGYWIWDDGRKWVLYRTGWGDGDNYDFIASEWNGERWGNNLPIRGVIGYHPKPKIKQIIRNSGTVTIKWEGPAAQLYNGLTDETRLVNRYVLERAPSPNQGYVPVTAATTDHVATIPDCCDASAFYRVKMLIP